MKIIPFGNKIQIKVEEAKAGSLALEGMPTSVECGEVIAVGEIGKIIGNLPIIPIEVGDKIFYKSWAVDIVTHEGVRYFFIDLSSNGICAIVK